MFAESDLDEFDDVQPDDEITDEPKIMSVRQSEMDTREVLGHSLSKHNGK